MKELSIEQKAKAYDEAIERAKSKIKNDKDHVLYEDDIIELFPALKESEDERIRKSLAAYFSKIKQSDMWDDEFSFGDILAWFEKQGKKDEEILILKDQIESLHAAIKAIKETHRIELEKQGEQKPTDKIGPKFKVGNKIKLARDPKYPARKIIAIQNDAYYFDEVVYLPFNRQDEWELVEQKPVFEMKTQEESLGVDSDTYSKIVDECVYGEQKPADKKGMNLVEEEMTPFQKKVFCIIDTTIEEEQGLKQVCDELLRLAHDEIIQNTAWSEEDRRMLIGLIDELDAIMNKATPNEISVYSKYINWLKSIRPKNTWKPSGEQIEYLAKAIATLGDEGNCKTASILNYLRVELKKLMEE